MRTFFGAPLHKTVGYGLLGYGLISFATCSGTLIYNVLNGQSTNLFDTLSTGLSSLEIFLGYTLASENKYCANTFNLAYNALFDAIIYPKFFPDRQYQKVDEINILRDVIDDTLQPIEHYHIQPMPNMRR